VDHRSIFSIGCSVFMDRQESCMRFVSTIGISYSSYSKSSGFLYQYRARVSSEINLLLLSFC
jgi:hypothetical protein